jgi:hypothetical protein
MSVSLTMCNLLTVHSVIMAGDRKNDRRRGLVAGQGSVEAILYGRIGEFKEGVC